MGEFFQKMVEERAKQDAMWGPGHDDTHTSLEWAGILAHEVGQVTGGSNGSIQDALVKVAAVAMAAYESIERMG